MSIPERAKDYIRLLSLQPHPEGGWFKETYRSNEIVKSGALPGRFQGDRCFATSIYFLLTSNNFSALHRIASDEQWHFYAGDPLTIHIIDQQGAYRPVTLGPDLLSCQTFQTTVSSGCWFGASVSVENGFSLVGCSVAPGFEFYDFELADREKLTELYPQHTGLIRRLTRD